MSRTTSPLYIAAINAGADAGKAAAALIAAVAQGQLSPGEAVSVVQMIEAYTRIALTDDFERRLMKLEAE